MEWNIIIQKKMYTLKHQYKQIPIKLLLQWTGKKLLSEKSLQRDSHCIVFTEVGIIATKKKQISTEKKNRQNEGS